MHALSEATQTSATHLFVHDGFMPEVTTATAVLLGHVEAQQPRLAQKSPRFPIYMVLGAPSSVVGKHFRLDEPRDGIAKRGQIIVHPVGGVLQRHGCVSFGI
jgi:hypothetical protein